MRNHRIGRVVRSHLPRTRESDQWNAVKDNLPKTVFQQFETLSLFTEGSLPMPLEELPVTFSQFRKEVEKTGERNSERLRIRTLTGPRHFNLQKQARQFDPDGEFVKRWQGNAAQPVGLHTVDAADWPL